MGKLEPSDREKRRVASETERMEAVYERRGYDDDHRYSDVDPVYLHRVHSIERRILEALRHIGIAAQLPSLQVMDYGCGNGKWFGRWLSWGAMPEHLWGTDIRPVAVDHARQRFPQVAVGALQGGVAPYPDRSVDLVFANLVLSSILAEERRQSAASDIQRLVRPGGHVLICDFAMNNPSNQDVRAVKPSDLRRHFHGLEVVYEARLVLAPPLARWLVPRSWFAADVLESAAPPLRTHRLMGFRAPAGGCKT